ncbi:MAG: VWA domain-containing protein [Moorea sp. SIOASIH]|uniref:VWA domain-containing protein n=1 Tax=Moorena sp. SIOASIH TaxID=2607817 RepID=UPI0013BC4F6A|nr:VWA domain-containing protein [Moorena sp. SIOASIH]NEO36305.1 VWA domain-containing protein [Moorena sp. SIOASIH]NEO91338.1 VWA domain-containing protein [Moorena sp. SIO3G5]
MYVPEELKDRDYTIIIDKSGSMTIKDEKRGTKTRWEVMTETTEAYARYCEEIDPDGITVYVFSSRFKRYDNVTTNKVEQIFQETYPMGGTYLDEVLRDALDNYFQRKANGSAKPNGEIFLVFTDGAPDDKPPVIDVIVNATRRIDKDSEIGISFIQVGSDPQAAQFLQELDKSLEEKGAKYGICNTLTLGDLEEIPPPEVLLRAINRG